MFDATTSFIKNIETLSAYGLDLDHLRIQVQRDPTCGTIHGTRFVHRCLELTAGHRVEQMLYRDYVTEKAAGKICPKCSERYLIISKPEGKFSITTLNMGMLEKIVQVFKLPDVPRSTEELTQLGSLLWGSSLLLRRDWQEDAALKDLMPNFKVSWAEKERSFLKTATQSALGEELIAEALTEAFMFAYLRQEPVDPLFPVNFDFSDNPEEVLLEAWQYAKTQMRGCSSGTPQFMVALLKKRAHYFVPTCGSKLGALVYAWFGERSAQQGPSELFTALSLVGQGETFEAFAYTDELLSAPELETFEILIQDRSELTTEELLETVKSL